MEQNSWVSINEDTRYGGFWIRVGASAIDIVIMLGSSVEFVGMKRS
jgi:hypothetical protein